MPSPFPGMDPYLEAHWRDVHASLIIYARDALQGVLPSALRARVEESVLLETPRGLGDHPLFPDVRVVEYTEQPRRRSRPRSRVNCPKMWRAVLWRPTVHGEKRGLEPRRNGGVLMAEPLLV